jgi:aspartyl-tRNA(Asn)/glutamyl-tRNA(Gln) amidotransferase subunit A
VTSREARARIGAGSRLNAFISLTGEEGDGPVVAVKDLIDVRGSVTTGGGIILPKEPALADATVIGLIRRHGCLVVGKTNLDEWAAGATSENPHYGAALNPRDESRVAGGSSGGSAAAVAAGMCDWAIGTDTGGSIRTPAALCGVVGVKPTHGWVSPDGVIPRSETLDVVGPLAPDVTAAFGALECMTHESGLVPTRPRSPRDFRLAVPQGWVDGLDARTATIWERVRAGLPEIPFPDRERMVAVQQIIARVEAAAYHQTWLQACPHLYGRDVLESLRAGLKISGVDYRTALAERRRLIAEVSGAMGTWDALVLPTTACIAPRLGTPGVTEPLSRFTRPFSLTGQPAISLPAPAPGLPVGIQVVGHLGADRALGEVALALERAWRYKLSLWMPIGARQE